MPEYGSTVQKINSSMLWVQLLAGPILWAVHFITSYLLVEAFCQLRWDFILLGMNALSLLVITLTILAVLGTVLFSIKSYRNWKTIHADRSFKDQLQKNSAWFSGPVDFMYFSGFLLSALFAVTILMVGVPAFFLRPCS